ncbi:MAG TPA: hypothetical protein VK916_07335, partial [Gillisia sp.]|nr:hypothetical protein [Gillisia sp.]
MTNSIRERSDVNLSVGRVSFSYFGKVKLNQVYVEDHHQDTLLYARELNTSLLSLRNLINNTPRLGNTTADGLKIKMIRYKGEETDNLSIILAKLRKEPTGEPKPFELFIRDIYVKDGYYTFIDENLEVPVILEFKDLNLQAEELKVVDSDFTVFINTLSAREVSGLEVVHMSTQFSYSPTQMVFQDLILETPNSYLDANLALDYDSFANFTNEVEIVGNFNESKFSTNDLRLFYEPFGENEN